MKRAPKRRMRVWFQFTLIFLVLIIPLLLGAVRGNIRANQRVVEAEKQRATQLSQVAADGIGNRMDRATNLLYNYYSSDSRLNMMRKAREYNNNYIIAKVRFFSELRAAAEWVTGADGYYYYTDRLDDFLATGKHGEIAEMEAYFRDRLSAGDALNGWVWDGERQRLILNITATQLHYGCWINLEGDVRALNASLNGAFEAAVDPTEAEEAASALEREGDFALGNSSVRLALFMNYAQIRKSLSPALLGNLTMIGVYILVLPVLLLVVYRMIIRPFREIEKAHHAVREGNLAYRIAKHSRYEEFDAVYQSFDRMVENIQNLRIENYEKEQEKQKMLLRNLMLQIQPHFLLNTFSMIYALVQTDRRAAVQDIVLYLSDYFRYLVRNDAGLLPFSEEWKLIQGYMKVAAIRYPDQVRLEADIDEELLSYRIPPLLVHNFLENSIKYGIDPELCMTIRFRVYREGGAVCFLIEDDGNGMPPETLSRNHAIISGALDLDSQTEHIGLYNSVKRLRFFYGDRASVTLRSAMGEGTSFLIRIEDSEQPEQRQAQPDGVEGESA